MLLALRSRKLHTMATKMEGMHSWRRFYADRKHRYRSKFPFLREDQIVAKLKRIWSTKKRKTASCAAGGVYDFSRNLKEKSTGGINGRHDLKQQQPVQLKSRVEKAKTGVEEIRARVEATRARVEETRARVEGTRARVEETWVESFSQTSAVEIPPALPILQENTPASKTPPFKCLSLHSLHPPPPHCNDMPFTEHSFFLSSSTSDGIALESGQVSLEYCDSEQSSHQDFISNKRIVPAAVSTGEQDLLCNLFPAPCPLPHASAQLTSSSSFSSCSAARKSSRQHTHSGSPQHSDGDQKLYCMFLDEADIFM